MNSDPINPQHYKHLPAEAIDIIEAAIAKAPSNESAYLHGQVLKYILRCWSKKGIEDLRKAKWYLDRLVSSLDETLAEASGASEKPSNEPAANPQGMLPPSGFRWLKCGDRFIDGDKSVDHRGNIQLISGCMVGDAVQVERLFIRKIETSSEPPRRYREPTMDDLQSGPVCCEVRDWDSEQWKARQLIQVHESGPFRFLCKNETCDNPLNWNQCRIEVT